MRPLKLEVDLGSLRLPNPVMVASGTFGFGQEYASLMDLNRLGAIVTKGISLEPRQGNPAPRTAETACGMLNAVGLQNPGFEGFVSEKMPFLRRVVPRVIVNILGNSVEDYHNLAAKLDKVAGIDAIEVNISCPNVKHGGIAFGSDPVAAAEVTSGVLGATRLPVLVKLSPNVTDLVSIAVRVAQAGAAGLTLINTVRGMALDYRTGKSKLKNGIGGLSGPAIKPIALRAVYEVAQAVSLPLVGCGGINTWQDGIEFLRAGASAIQVGSATFRSPDASIAILDGMALFLEELGCKTANDIVSTVTL